MRTIDDKDLYVAEDGTYEYEDQPFTGVALQYSRQGAMISQIEYVDGFQDGLAQYWYPSGEKKGEETFRKNALMGDSREWYQDGRLKRETLFEYSIRLRERQWDENGNLVRDFSLGEDDPLSQTLKDFRRIYGEKDAE